MFERLKAACLITLGLYLVYLSQNGSSDSFPVALPISEQHFPWPSEGFIASDSASLTPAPGFSSLPLAY